MAPISEHDLCVDSSTSKNGDITTRNFISGVTILLALFGRDVTNQFLSQSVSVLDWVTFSMAPLGIPFAVLAVIRISRMKFLKSMAGLAEDKVSDVEKDLMSSTSEEVSELWDGEQVRRIVGPSRVSELFFTGLDLEGPPYGFHTAQEAKYRDNILTRKHDWTIDRDWEFQLWNKHFGTQTERNPKLEKFYPPNMTLNLGPYRRLSFLCACSIGGVILQGAVIMIAALTTFYSPMRNCFRSEAWSFYSFSGGTGLLSLGLIVCARSIDLASQDVLWKPNKPDILAIWLQERSESDSVPSYVITKTVKHEFVSSHRPCGKAPVVRLSLLIILCIAVGFLLQAIGLSALHWPSQVLQFLATIIMFLARSYLRRQDPPDRVKEIQSGYCKDWIAKMFLLDPKNLYRAPSPDDPDIAWKLHPLDINNNGISFGGCKCAQNLLGIRRYLANITHDEGQHVQLASYLCLAVSAVMQHMCREINAWAEIDTWRWGLEVQVDGPISETVELTVNKTDNEWQADEKELQAVMSLLLSSSGHLGDTTNPRRSILCIGPSKSTIAEHLEAFGKFVNLGLYQTPPVDKSQDLKITFDTEMIAGVDDMFMEKVGEENRKTTTLATKKIFAPKNLDSDSGAMLTRVSNISLGQLYAQQIFISFMWAVGNECGRKNLPRQLEVPSLKTLIRKIELTRLGDIEFARVAIIPPLSHNDLIHIQGTPRPSIASQ